MRHGTCVYCGESSVQIQQDHIKARCLDGQDVEENLVPACARCNSDKRARSLLDWDPIRVLHAAKTNAHVAHVLIEELEKAHTKKPKNNAATWLRKFRREHKGEELKTYVVADTLIGISTACHTGGPLHGLSLEAARKASQRAGFPRPVGRGSDRHRQRLYRQSDLEAWMAQRCD